MPCKIRERMANFFEHMSIQTTSSLPTTAARPASNDPRKKESSFAGLFDAMSAKSANHAQHAAPAQKKPVRDADRQEARQNIATAKDAEKISKSQDAEKDDKNILKASGKDDVAPSAKEENTAESDAASVVTDTANAAPEAAPSSQAVIASTPTMPTEALLVSQPAAIPATAAATTAPTEQDKAANPVPVAKVETQKQAAASAPDPEENKNGTTEPEPKQNSASGSSQSTEKKNGGSFEAKSGRQISETESESFSKKLTEAVKEKSEASSVVDALVAKADEEVQKNTQNIPLQQKSADAMNNQVAHTADRDAAILQQQHLQTEKAGTTTSTRFEGVSATRAPQTPDQIETKQFFVNANGNRIAVTLEPEGLGKLNINLSLNQGLVNAHIQAADPAAKNLLETNMHEILNTLMKEGVAVGGFSVSLRQGEAGGADEQRFGEDTAARSNEQTLSTQQVSKHDITGRINLFV